MFRTIAQIKTLKEKKFFIEKVNIYYKLILAFSLKNNLELNSSTIEIDESILNKLLKLNVIVDRTELINLEKILKKELFNNFINSISFSLKYKNELGSLLDKLDTEKRLKKQKLKANKSKPKLVDFFCGAGGLSLGFIQEGFHVDLANDYEDVCIQTYRYNHPEIPENRVIHGDIRKVVDEIDTLVTTDIDGVVGGPPCQGFSSANQQRMIDDPRNELYKYFIRAVEIITPKFVVMENVRGMLPYAEQVVDDYKNIKAVKDDKEFTYSIFYKVLVSDDFGVAQKRQRLIFIALRNDIVESKEITPIDIFNRIEKSNSNTKRHVLNDALQYIKPLEAPRIKNMTEVDDEITGKKIDYNLFKGNENGYLNKINNNKTIDFVFNHKARYTNDVNYEIYKRLDQGNDGTNSKISDIMPYKHRNHVFKDKYFKLVADKPSRTITAHLKMDCHSHIHPFQVRSITPREAARIQSFPDDYVFLGAYLKTYMQIGNAVPPMMARGIAKIIKEYI
ncbi:DNA cytosine methyltransferase [Polaribacter undariae]|uniref:Cytosine-specific methyltransferase n=1 Tax=Polaribacter sejongensis TaxID=985043 RepID=A0AAJ1QVV6_9FLAO|nr:DNA cytosine methyltransferase [Polaribacter undariae]MDN3619294.1 DNA cytosine methyltransferase [Polaribacter undariae]UWD33506.1 DNA cytosine methyltransferase [Polaribacter undariae]